MNSKEYKLPNGKIAVFEYDVCGIGKITLECMDELMAMIADRPQGSWESWWNEDLSRWGARCTSCHKRSSAYFDFCPNCGARMKGTDDD